MLSVLPRILCHSLYQWLGLGSCDIHFVNLDRISRLSSTNRPFRLQQAFVADIRYLNPLGLLL